MGKKSNMKDLVDRICGYQGDDYELFSIVKTDDVPARYIIEVGIINEQEEK